MPNATLIIRAPGQPPREITLTGGASIGRAADNSICIEDGSISRYHAIVEVRAGEFWLTDLGSVNGTTVNGELLSGERKLLDSDLISTGGVIAMEFRCADARPPTPAEGPREESVAPPLQQPPGPQGGGLSPKLVAAAVVGGLAVTVLAALLLSGALFGSDSNSPGVRIASPQSGTKVRGPVAVRLQLDKPGNISRVTYQLDGIAIASAEVPPFDTLVDPTQLIAKIPNLGTGTHILTVTVEEKDGDTKQPEGVLLAFEVGGEEIIDGGGGGGTPTNGAGPGGGPIPPAVDVPAMAQSLASQLSGKSGYVFTPGFAEQIRLLTNEYRFDATDSARRYRREICRAFGDQGLPALMGFVMAMSQSRFREEPSGTPKRGAPGIGLWRVPPSIATAQGYLAQGETEAVLADPKRSAEIAAAYMKYLDGLFGRENFMYSIACFGLPLAQAGEIRTRLEQVADPAARRDFWRMVELGVVPREAADRVARFFAAGIIGENPQAFGLRPETLSSLC